MTGTLVLFAAGWVAFASLVSPKGFERLRRHTRPRATAAITLAATVTLGAIPVCALIVLFVEGLATAGPGSALRQCGRLIAAIVSRPWSRPVSATALLLLAVLAARFVAAATGTWRSQARSARFVRGCGRHLVALTSEPIAFTAGLLRPRIVVSEGLRACVPGDLYAVVLEHEEAHRRGRHPLWLFVVWTFARAMPVPPMRWAARACRLALEEAADRRAADVLGSRELVAEAVARVALTRVEAAAGFEGSEVQRVRRLLEEPGDRRPLPGLLLGVGVLAVLAFALGHAVHCADAAVTAAGTVVCLTG